MPFGYPQRANVAALSLRSYLRESKHLQLLRLQVKETCKHERGTQAQKQRLLPSATHPCPTNFLSKTSCLLRLPPKRAVEAPAPTEKEKTFSSFACRSWWLCGERCSNSLYVFLLHLFEERQCQGDPRGNVLVPFLSPFLCGTTKKGQQMLSASACHRHSVSVRRRSCKKFRYPPKGHPHDHPRIPKNDPPRLPR